MARPSLAENVAALPKERYRVEKYNVADPADIDGDCIDDITELADPVGMNPVNPAPAIDISDGAVAVPDRETFEKLSWDVPVGRGVPSSLKFVVLDMDTARPRVYFQNTKKHQGHSTLLDTIGIDRYQDGLLRGTIAYDPELLASDGSPGVYYYGSNIAVISPSALRSASILCSPPVCRCLRTIWPCIPAKLGASAYPARLAVVPGIPNQPRVRRGNLSPKPASCR